jgi:hypothetical protein
MILSVGASFKVVLKIRPMRIRPIIFLSLVFLLLKCVPEKVDSPGVDQSEAYFPLVYGHYIDYQVDSIVFDDAPGGNKKDSIRFQLREQIANYQITDKGDTVFYIHRFTRPDSTATWQLRDVWTSTFEENNALRTEENLTFRKMTMPLYKGLRWIGTSYIYPYTEVLIGTENVEAYQNWEAKVLGIDEAGHAGSFAFPVGSVMRVEQTNTDDGIMKRYVHESYVRNLGLVSRVDSILDSRCIDLGDFGPCFGVPWTLHASKGYILSQVMIGHN